MTAKIFEGTDFRNATGLWDEPTPLPEGLPSVRSLEPKMVPESLRDWTVDIADRMLVPIEFPVIPAIVGIGSLVGRRAVIQPKQFDSEWQVTPNLWGGLIARPGLMKSPVIAAVMKAFDRLAIRAQEMHELSLERFEGEREVAEARQKAWKHKLTTAAKNGDDDELRRLGESPLPDLEEPTMRRYRTNDATVEKLAELLLQNPAGLMVYRDELVAWLRLLDKAGREGDRAFFLESWNGSGHFTVDRIGRGSLFVPALCLSVFGGIQPGPLSAYVYSAARGGAGDDGLLQRFQLLVWPDSTGAYKKVDRRVDQIARDRAYNLVEKIDQLEILGDETPEPIRFNPEAQELFDDWRARLEGIIRSDEISPTLESHLAKYRSLMPSLALIFHLVDAADGRCARGEVSMVHAGMAASWCAYLETHARRVYSSAESPEMSSARELLKRVRPVRVNDFETSVSGSLVSNLRAPRGRDWTCLAG